MADNIVCRGNELVDGHMIPKAAAIIGWHAITYRAQKAMHRQACELGAQIQDGVVCPVLRQGSLFGVLGISLCGFGLLSADVFGAESTYDRQGGYNNQGYGPNGQDRGFDRGFDRGGDRGDYRERR